MPEKNKGAIKDIIGKLTTLEHGTKNAVLKLYYGYRKDYSCSLEIYAETVRNERVRENVFVYINVCLYKFTHTCIYT